MTDAKALAIVAANFPFAGSEDEEFRQAVAHIALTDHQTLYDLIHRIKRECQNESGCDLRSVVKFRKSLSVEQRREISVRQTRNILVADYIDGKE